ncbi:nuclear transport factor 2 family protein [Erythrobacter sp. THAF29]|uniref:nuclear transport factor 2 family protein n=1 Tax=Erythrobacter sp. THAF29 TaxID=2587851 RepID=UPI001267E8CD|nr:nuclear transport factor 2 family protein [Erythrobacter sp. THAF29]QFT77304.1 SnoaL-like domain protein [Erythrobacter sp. THAF29]
MRPNSLFAAALIAGSAAVVPLATATLHAQEQSNENEAQKLAAARIVQGSIDAVRARNFERWLSFYSPDKVVIINDMMIDGRAQLRQVYEPVFKMNLPMMEILESGWTGERIYVLQREFHPSGREVETYAEYEVRGDKIVAVYGRH